MRLGWLGLLLWPGLAMAQDLRGHGGPVGALAVSGLSVLSGSFDTRAILWDGNRAEARLILRAHDGPVTAVAFAPGGFVLTGGQDGRVVVWDAAGQETARHALHEAPVRGLVALPDGFASAGWDGRITLHRPETAPQRIEAHQGQIAGLAALPDGRLASAGTDLRLKVWEMARLQNGPVMTAALAAPPAALVADADGGGIVVASADGALRRFALDGTERERFLTERPVIALAAGQGRIVAGAVTGEVFVLDAATLNLSHRFMAGPGPVWALALSGDDLLTAGADGAIRRWSADGTALAEPAVASPDYPAALAGTRGAEVWRACAVCHTLTPDDGNRAGPSLHGVLGRRIGTVAGYDYSDALRAMDLVWTPETISRLFEIGPEAYTPGSRMPDQRVPDPADRAALIAFLKAAGGAP
jgi:cytochrome c